MPNILARASEDGLLPYCNTGVKSDGNNRPGPLFRQIRLGRIKYHRYTYKII
jgi:hypothetical protein